MRGLPDPEQLALAELRALEQRRAETLMPHAKAATSSTPARAPRPGHGPRAQPALPVIEIDHTLPDDQRGCPACGGALTEMTGQTEDSERITTAKLTYQIEHHAARSIAAPATAPW